MPYPIRSGVITVNVSATDNIGVTKVELYINNLLKGTLTSAPYNFQYNTNQLTDGDYYMYSRAYDAAGNVGQSSTVYFTVKNVDTTPPTVSITSPSSIGPFSGTIPVSVSASDNVGISKVELYIDSLLYNTDTNSPYNFSIDSTLLSNGNHILTAKAYDYQNNTTTSTAITITVNNVVAPPVSQDSWVSKLRTGVNIVGMETPYTSFDSSTGPVAGTDYPVMTQAFFDNISSKGIKCVRVLFGWEAMQSSLFGPIPASSTGNYYNYYVNYKRVVDAFLAKGIYVLICPWQYNTNTSDTDITYRSIQIGEGAVTSAAFADMWAKMAALFSYDQKIMFGLINEPHDVSGGISTWFTAAQSAINSIRGTGSTNYILVPGDNYSSPGYWVSSTSASKFALLTDTISPKRLVAECHNYGSDFPTSAGNNLTTWIQPMVDHARTNGYKIFVGEIARSSNPTTATFTTADQTAWTNWCNYCITNKDVIIGWAWWGATDNTQWGWGTDFYHWSLYVSGSNSTGSTYMNLVQSTFTEVSI